MIDVAELAAFAAVPAPTGAEEPRLAWLEQRLEGAPGRSAARRRGQSGVELW